MNTDIKFRAVVEFRTLTKGTAFRYSGHVYLKCAPVIHRDGDERNAMSLVDGEVSWISDEVEVLPLMCLGFESCG